MLLQDVRDNKTEAANAAPQALRLCQMVGSIALNVNTPVHFGFETTSSSHVQCIAKVLVLTQMTICIYMHLVLGSLSHTHWAQITMSISTVMVVFISQPVAEQHVISPAKSMGLGLPCAVCPFEPSTCPLHLSQLCLFDQRCSSLEPLSCTSELLLMPCCASWPQQPKRCLLMLDIHIKDSATASLGLCKLKISYILSETSS